MVKFLRFTKSVDQNHNDKHDEDFKKKIQMNLFLKMNLFPKMNLLLKLDQNKFNGKDCTNDIVFKMGSIENER